MQLKPGIKLLSEVEGVGAVVEKGMAVKIRLKGWLSQGENIHKEHETEFVVGSRRLIPGIEYAVEGMRVGGIRKVKISPHLGYRHIGVQGYIPPNALLIYEIQLISIDESG